MAEACSGSQHFPFLCASIVLLHKVSSRDSEFHGSSQKIKHKKLKRSQKFLFQGLRDIPSTPIRGGLYSIPKFRVKNRKKKYPI